MHAEPAPREASCDAPNPAVGNAAQETQKEKDPPVAAAYNRIKAAFERAKMPLVRGRSKILFRTVHVLGSDRTRRRYAV
jgi:hypothetical protein